MPVIRDSLFDYVNPLNAAQPLPMSELTVRAGQFQRLLDYIEQIGLDSVAVAARVNIVPQRLLNLDSEQLLPAIQYARLHQQSVVEMQKLGHPIPWGAGLGSEAFELMCRTIITARTLGEALKLAARFDTLLYPLIGYKVGLLDEGDSPSVKLSYRINVEEGESALAPAHWDRSGYQATVARASGLKVWNSFCGWLTGRSLELEEVKVAAPYLNEAYHDSLSRVFHCPIHFDADENTLEFPRESLQRRLVHTRESLAEFLESSVYHLIAVDKEIASTSTAIKSLVTIDLPRGLPSFSAVAESLHMSESSLRRRLQKENTSYQALKDEIRCEVAIDRLLNQNAKVAEIAEYLGFTETSSFVRSFKGWTGQTPKSYRERIQALGQA
ncbi:MAG: AraC-like DNA-binding protein [Halioglobus sp.]